MAKIAFLVWPEIGHINPTVKLAQDLISRGHKVVYFGALEYFDSPGAEDYVESLNFKYLLVKSDQTLIDDYNKISVSHSRYKRFRLLFRLLYGRTIAQKHYSIIRDLFKRQFDRLITINKFDLFLYDSVYSFMGIICKYHNLPCLQFTTDMPRRYDPIVPPPFSHIIPKNSRVLNSKIKFKWFFHFFAMFVKRQVYKIFGSHFTYRQSSPSLIRLIKELCEEYDFKSEHINFSTYLTPLIEEISEIVFYPQQFDFPRKNRNNIHWLGPSIAFNRQKIDFPWDKLDTTKTLVYCSLGTQTWRIKKNSQKIYRSIRETFKYLPDYQLVLVCGQPRMVTGSEHELPNVITVEKAPQLELLKKSKLVITNAGFNTIKECMYYGIPIIAIPMRADQPRNAALVEYNNIGVRCSAEKITSKLLCETIRKVMKDPIIRKQCKKFQMMFKEEQGNLDGVILVENMLTRVGEETGEHRKNERYGINKA